jgi:hypothetical protein
MAAVEQSSSCTNKSLKECLKVGSSQTLSTVIRKNTLSVSWNSKMLTMHLERVDDQILGHGQDIVQLLFESQAIIYVCGYG